jgi:hypothetical protein
MKNCMKIMDRMTPCFDLNERKVKTMKTTLKTLTAISLICSLMSSVKAEEKFTKEEIAQAERKEKERLGSIWFYVRHYLTKEENKKLNEIIDSGLTRSLFVNSLKGEKTLEGRMRSYEILEHILSSLKESLTKEEKEKIYELIGRGFERKHSLTVQPSRKKEIGKL